MMSQKHTLSNGVRILVDSDSRFHSASVAFCLLGGSSDETRDDIGRTHLLEHALFKRTRLHSTAELACIVDDLGGEVNAFTDTDSLCLHADVPAKDIPTVLELFRELLLESAYTEEDVALEREVIRQEIIEADDDPEQAVYQRFSERFWPGHSISYPVAGYLETLGVFDRQSLVERQEELLVGSRILLVAAGNVDFEALVAFAEKHFGGFPSAEAPHPVKPLSQGGFELFERPVNQVFVLFGREAPSRVSPEFVYANIVATAFGGGMSSRLFQRVREQQGLAYDIGAELDSYVNAGALLVSCTLERSNINRALPLLFQEYDALRSEGLTTEELERAKRFICATLQMEVDSMNHRLWRLLESELYFGRAISASDVVERYSAVGPTEIRQFLDSMGKDSRHELLVLGGDVEKYALPSTLQARFG